jgi:hypothetical protein
MKSKSYTRSKRIVCHTSEYYRWIKSWRHRQVRRSVRQQLKSGVETPAVNWKPGQDAWLIA